MAVMAQANPRAFAARLWLLLLCPATAALLRARAQPDSNGFISIDCGLDGPSYVDDGTNLSYQPDSAFIDTGENRSIPPHNITPKLLSFLRALRSFPNGTHNCYTLQPLTAGNKYLIRATFLYSNYDGLNSPPVFDLYIGVNLWARVDVWGRANGVFWEAIVVLPDNFVQVCLVNTGTGTPFISGLELRPLKSSVYPQVNATQGLNLLTRHNFGPTDVTDIVRYPDDPYDRLWYPIINTTNWDIILTDKMIKNYDNDQFDAPSKVMQTAATPRNASEGIRFQLYYVNTQSKDPSSGCIPILYFSELEPRLGTNVRQFYVNINDKLWYPQVYTPPYLYSDAMYNTNLYGGNTQYNVTINSATNSTLPPIINAYEVYSVISTANNGTDSQDVSAITAIKVKYGVTKNWIGDPCVFAWTGLACTSASFGHPRVITGVNMSFSSLDEDITSIFANLTAVEYIDLSYNNLTGSIPDALSQLPSLTMLDLTGNNLSGSIPVGLLKKIQAGSLTLKYSNNPNLCTDGDSCTTAKVKSKLAIYIVVPMALTLVAVSMVALFFLMRRKKQGWMNSSVKPRNETSIHVPAGDASSSLRLENRRFTYKELERITNNFQEVIGRGGFGYVYNGILEDDTQVAVKLRSESSNQGVKEFITEAQILTRIHHKNLVSMIGYCKDGEHMALVYEYMSEGTLQEHIIGKHLTWRQRLRIAFESAQGLEYLHKGCNPRLIHRDVKATNILLNAKLEAKVADFGLSRAFNLAICTHVSTNTLVGTPGYVDPEYQATMQPTTKSDVFSFGVVLLELVTGKPAILHDPDPISIIKWVMVRLARGQIESIMDERMSDDPDLNSVWKAADVALKCTSFASTQRPTMSDVVTQLQECLELEEGRAGCGATQSFYTGNSSDVNYNTNNAYTSSASRRSAAFEMVEMMASGPATR